MKKVHEVFRKKRIEKGIQQKYIAMCLGKCQSLVSLYENGHVGIPAEVFIEWAKILELELSDFCEGEGR